jgi:hypothetical protein
MAESVQCANCGAVLLEEDIFCGECGAPRPSLAATARPPEPVAAPPPSAPMPATPLSPTPGLPPVQPASRRAGVSEGWRTAAIVAAILAVVAAVGLWIAGLLLAFVVPDPELGQAATQDMIVGSSVCCFCPGGLSLAVAIVLWAVVIRRKRTSEGARS